MRRRFFPPPLILLYHRIAEPESDAQLLCVSPRHFAEHLAVLRARVIPLAAMTASLRRGGFPAGKMAITFDDGYVDNLRHAKPALEAARAPATIFIPTGFVGANREFWWDELESLLLYPGKFPAQLALTIHGTRRCWPLGPDASYEETAFARHRRWSVFQTDTPTARHAVYRELGDLLKPMTRDQQDAVLAEMRAQLAEHRGPGEERRCVTVAELAALGQGGLIDFGAHTITHRWLSGASDAEQLYEIRESRLSLEKLLARPVDHLAFPYGNHNGETTHAMRAAGLKVAVTTEERALCPNDDCHQLPRVIVRDWDGETFRQKLAAWLQP